MLRTLSLVEWEIRSAGKSCQLSIGEVRDLVHTFEDVMSGKKREERSSWLRGDD